MDSFLPSLRDLACHPDSNYQHLLHVFEGYRARLTEKGHDCPYSPGSARASSWNLGWNRAKNDVAVGRGRAARTLVSEWWEVCDAHWSSGKKTRIDAVTEARRLRGDGYKVRIVHVRRYRLKK
jgi:ribosome modulation factor